MILGQNIINQLIILKSQSVGRLTFKQFNDDFGKKLNSRFTISHSSFNIVHTAISLKSSPSKNTLHEKWNIWSWYFHISHVIFTTFESFNKNQILFHTIYFWALLNIQIVFQNEILVWKYQSKRRTDTSTHLANRREKWGWKKNTNSQNWTRANSEMNGKPT